MCENVRALEPCTITEEKLSDQCTILCNIFLALLGAGSTYLTWPCIIHLCAQVNAAFLIYCCLFQIVM